MMDYLPICFDLKATRTLVVGGGSVAARKTEILLRAGGRITVVAPELGPDLQGLVDAGRIEHRPAAFEEGMLEGFGLVIAATDVSEINDQVSRLARARGLLVNVVDEPARSNFIMPAIVDRSPLMVAISSGGRSPVLARMLRAKLERTIPAAYGRLAGLAARFRDTAKRRISDPVARRRFWEDVLDGPVAEQVLSGHDDEAEQAMREGLTDGATSVPRGEVYLVGGGPGDPELVTLKALRLMQRADIVLYDRLTSPAILELVRRDAERLYVGKAAGRHACAQDEINRHLVTLAGQGRRVLRLKGGDPFLFGRGGEEVAACRAHGIPVQVVPGVTAALGCSSYAGIPLTHRDHAHACLMVTGHMRDGTLELPWQAMVQPHQTVVVYMALKALPQLCRGLMDHGLPPEHPAALVEKGTTREQRVVTGTLATLPAVARAEGVQSPALAMVGDVVRLRAGREPEDRERSACHEVPVETNDLQARAVRA